jgi:hypothetical protein
MVKKINLGYIRELEYFLEVLTDDELDDFRINDTDSINKVIEERKKQFLIFGPKSQQNVLDALEYLLISNSFEKHWRYVMSGHIPVDEIIDKKGFLLKLFKILSGREPDDNFNVNDIELDNTIPKGCYSLPVDK